MAKQYDKETIFNALKLRVAQKGFQLNVQKGGDNRIASSTPTLVDMLKGIAEATAELLNSGNLSAELIANDYKIGPPGLQQPVATVINPPQTNVIFDITTDPTFFTWLETFHSLLQASYPEPGNGSPSVFATALKTLVSIKPTEIKARIDSGSSKVKVTV